MLDRLKEYLQSDTKTPKPHDLFYVVHDDSDVFLFFSLQASLVVSLQKASPEDLSQLKCAYHYAKESDVTGYKDRPDIDIFKAEMQMFPGLEKYDSLSDEETMSLIDMIAKIISCKQLDMQNNIYVDRIIPSIELVNFCKNHNAEKKWCEIGFKPALGATLFWYKIMPIIKSVSELIGCVYVAIFAADVSEEKTDEKRNLIQYYKHALYFERDPDLCAVKPYYDWRCVFLCQEIKTLVQKAEQFKQLYLSEPTEDDV